MAGLKSERHHWWPEAVSEHWADANGGVNWVLPGGEIRRSSPRNFGVIGNGHHIKLGMDSTADSPWDQSFEIAFQNADSEFPHIIAWLDTLGRCEPLFDQEISARILPQAVSDHRFATLIECLVSLAARSPMHREKGVALAEHHRGPLPEHERRVLIGLNIRSAHHNAVRNIGSRGKIMVIFSPGREFIYGDGFFNNLTVQGEHWHSPKLFAPLTPSIGVLFARPMSYTTEPRLVTLVTSPSETDALNIAVQTYAKNMLFYRSERPPIDESFMLGKHQVFRGDHNPVDQMIYNIPGISPRDPSRDLFEDFLKRHRVSP